MSRSVPRGRAAAADAGDDAVLAPSLRPLVDVRLEDLTTEAGPPPHLRGISLHVRYG